MNRSIIPIVGIVWLLSACVIGNKYSRTDLKLPNQYRTQAPVLTADTVLLPWRTFFNDPILIDLLEQALEKNNDLAVAKMTLQQLDLSYRQAKQRLTPTVDLYVGATRNWLSKSSLNGSLSEQYLGTNYLDDYSALLRVNWEADIWGKTKMQKEGAWADYLSQRESGSALKTTLIAQAAQAYYNLITLDELQRVAYRNVALGDSTVRMIRMQYASGLVTSLAVEQAEAQKKTAELLIPLGLQNIAIQENALSILCGSYPDSIKRATNLSWGMEKAVFPTGVPALLLSRRPDVKSAEYAVISANARTGLAKTALYPTLSLTPSLGTNSFLLSGWFNLPGSIVKTMGANLTQPLLQRKTLKTAYETAVIDQAKAVTRFKQVVMNAVGEVSSDLNSLNRIEERLTLIAQKQASLSKATQDAMLLYKSGMATYLEVITAQNNALLNELDAISVKQERVNALTNLYRALGGGADS